MKDDVEAGDQLVERKDSSHKDALDVAGANQMHSYYPSDTGTASLGFHTNIEYQEELAW